MSEDVLKKDKVVDIKSLDKIKNVKVKLCAELGRATISLKEAVEYDIGSIVALNKLEDETLDVFVDDILIAKAKVVAIENSYGIKIVKIIDNRAKIANQS